MTVLSDNTDLLFFIQCLRVVKVTATIKVERHLQFTYAPFIVAYVFILLFCIFVDETETESLLLVF